MDQLVRGANQANARLEGLEQEHARSREQGESKDRDLAAGRAREHQLQQQLFDTQQRHGRGLTDRAQAQILTPQPANPGFDMAALQQVISEVQGDRISKGDIKQLIDDAVRSQLSGVARTSDIESAASRMEQGLNRVPTGASAAQVQQTVQQELAIAVHKVARHMPTQPQKLEGQAAQPDVSWAHHAPQTRTEEELPDNDHRSRSDAYRLPSQHLKALPSAKGSVASFASNGSPFVESALAQFQPAANSSSKGRASKSRASVAPAADNALAGVKNSEGYSSKGSRMSTVSAQEPGMEYQTTPRLTEGALSQKFQINARVEEAASKSRSSKMRGSVVAGPDNALTLMDDQRGTPSRTAKMSTMSVHPSTSNAMAFAGPGELQQYNTDPKRSSKISTASVQPSTSNAMIRPGSGEVQRFHGQESRSSKKLAASIQPARSNALGQPGKGNSQQYTSPAQVKASAQSQGGKLNRYGGHQGLPELPDDFPDNASQVTSWQRRQAPQQPMADQNTVVSTRPRNDRREQNVGSPLRQLAFVSGEDDGMAMVKQSKDLSKQIRR